MRERFASLFALASNAPAGTLYRHVAELADQLLAEMLCARGDALSRAGRQKDADKVFSVLSERFPDHSVAADAALARLT